MKINPKNLTKLIKKASFNFVFEGIRLSFTKDKIISREKSLECSAILELKNDVLSGFRKKQIDIDLRLEKLKATYRNTSLEKMLKVTLGKLDTATAEITNTHFVITDNNGAKTKLGLCDYVIDDKPILPRFFLTKI